MALSEFMPYGAPELLEGAESRLARSTGVASLVVVVCACLIGVLSLRHGTLPLAPVVDPRNVDLLPPIELQDFLELMHASAPPQTAIDPHADVRAVPEAPEPVAPLITDLPVLAEGNAVGEPGAARGFPLDGTGAVVPDADPPQDAVIITDEYPALVRCEEPRYPDLAREAGVEGTVRVLVLVGTDGRVRNAVIAPGGSVPMLDEAALAAARTCVFTPALVDRHPVKVWVSRSYRFRLH